MKKVLLTTVAVAAVVGYSAMASAQNSEGQSKGPAGAQQEQKAAPGGAGGGMMHPQGGAQSAPKTLSPSGQSAQGPAGAKQDERMGQSQDQKETTTPQKGAQDEQRERSTQQKGAQGEPSTQQKGAQDERSTQQKGAQEETSKSGLNAQKADQSKGGRGASVQLSQAQRSKIQAVIGHNSSARLTTNVNFNVTVGAVVPRDVHGEVLPEDVVEIVPQYEGYDYVIVGDNILIIDPDSLEIVAVIPA